MTDNDRPAAPQHTPPPYVADITENGLLIISAPDADAYHECVAVVGDMETTSGQDHATAEFIARACNSYLPMLAALRAARAEFDHIFGSFDFEAWAKSWGNGRQHPAKQVLDMIDAAVAAAQQDGGAV